MVPWFFNCPLHKGAQTTRGDIVRLTSEEEKRLGWHLENIERSAGNRVA